MTQQTVISIIQRECTGNAEFSIVGSLTTSSVYCIIKVGNAETKFRISDHYAPKHKRNIRTLVYGENTKKESVARFVRNVIKDMKVKSTIIAFEKIKKL